MRTSRSTSILLALVVTISLGGGCTTAVQNGGSGQPCYSNGTCNTGLACLAGICVAAMGDERQPCYGNGTCNVGLVCASDVCVRLADAGSDGGGTDDASMTSDAGMVGDAGASSDASDSAIDGSADASTADVGADGAICGHAMTAPYGTLVGRAFRPLTLANCAGISQDFYGADYCSFSYTVVTMTAEWNHPSGTLLDTIGTWRGSYVTSRAMRFIDITVQDATYNPPTGATCSAWQSAHATPIEWMDPVQLTNSFFPDGALPAVVVIDATGVIRYTADGATVDAASLRTALDALP